MLVKRRLSRDDSDDETGGAGPQHQHHQQQPQPRRKRARLDHNAVASRPPSRDIISHLPAELVVRILSYMNEVSLLEISTVSRLFHRVTSDPQLWRAHYYRRFILPRAHLIPGFKNGAASNSSSTSYTNMTATGSVRAGRVGAKNDTAKDHPGSHVDWKKSYKLLHNWARGRCDVEELHFHPRQRLAVGKTVVKVVEGLAITADASSGLLVWDLRTRSPIAEAPLESYRGRGVRPTCLAVDDDPLSDETIGIAAGFEDGTFGVWKLDLRRRELSPVCRYDTTSFGGLAAVAYCYPYVLAASKGGVITLWTLDPVNSGWYDPTAEESSSGTEGHEAATSPTVQNRPTRKEKRPQPMRRPRMLRSLRSQTTKQPLTLSIRRVAASTIASIVYTIDTVNGWCIGIQDLDIRPTLGLPEIVDSRLAYSMPIRTRGSASSSPESTPERTSSLRPGAAPGLISQYRDRDEDSSDDDYENNDGPMRLCYSHPYLLATLPDNTLVLHRCHSSPTSLSISAGTRLWGHTSGISDAEITSRGKAVSVSSRGDEIRVWELEGRVGGSSIEVRPRQNDGTISPTAGTAASKSIDELEFRKNKVDFDDEMVIVLKEGPDGKESLMVYDFA